MFELTEQLDLPLKFEANQFHTHTLQRGLCRVCFAMPDTGVCRHAHLALCIRASTDVITFSGLGAVTCKHFTTTVDIKLRERGQREQPSNPQPQPDFGG